ncbi:ComEC/Rec2 family competence protein [Microbacteriaceae bacterium 4G12]
MAYAKLFLLRKKETEYTNLSNEILIRKGDSRMKYVRIVLLICCFTLCMDLSSVSYIRYHPSVHAIKHISSEAELKYGKAVPKLRVIFLKVGQGDATLLVLPNGRTILVDGGPPEAGELLVHKLMERGIKHLDLVIGTHPDMDHIGGLATVIEQMPVSIVLDSGKPYYSLTYRMYVRSIKKRKIPFILAKEGQFLPFDPTVSIQVLNNGKSKTQNNESSIVMKVRYNKADFLLTGDADTSTEKEVMKQYNVHADVLKIGHHGSYTSTCKAFLQKVDPQFAVLSYEKGNPYGHPHQSVMKRLQRHGVQIYTTVKEDVEFKTDGNSFEIQKGPPIPLLK